MPIVFEEVHGEISSERGSGPARVEETQEADEAGELMRRIKRELAIAAERQARVEAN